MAEMVCSALVQEAVSRGFSSWFSKREERASQGRNIKRLEMAVSDMEFALERSAKLPITDVSLLHRRKMIKCAYVEAAELLEKHKQQAVQGQEKLGQGMKRKLWMIRSKDPSVSSFAGLNTDDVRRLERFADYAGKFVRDVESGCSLRHYTFCNPLVRHLVEGKTLEYTTEQGNWLRDFYIWPTCSEERGVEAVLGYHCADDAAAEKSFKMCLAIRISESTDIAGVAIRCLQSLTSQFKLEAEAEYAVGELTLLANSQDISHSYALPWVGIQEQHIKDSQLCRPDPACCKACRHGLCPDNSVSSQLSHIFPEQVIYFSFICYISALEYGLHSSSDAAGRRVSRARRLPLEVSVGFMPHDHEVSGNEELDCFALETIGNNTEKWGASIQEVAETVRSNATNCFFRQPELTEYRMNCYSKHGGAFFVVEKPSTERAGAPKTSRRSNTPSSTKRRRQERSNWR